METKFFKLKNGEEFIAGLIDEDNGFVHFEQPVMPLPDAVPGKMVFHPWCQWSSERTFRINEDEFLFIKPAAKSITDAYEEALGLIVKPNKQIII